jgi:SAM-dependent methyltransferase
LKIIQVDILYNIKLRSFIKGTLTLIPAVDRFTNRAAGAAVSARYFYSVWLRHLTTVAQAKPNFRFDIVAELGPGDALGLGICALLSGSTRYIGLDRIPFGVRADNLHMLDELHKLFKSRAEIPGEDEFPGVFPKIQNYSFPNHLLTDERLEVSLEPSRIIAIRKALLGDMSFTDSALISYVAPWDANKIYSSGTVDFLVSQAVMEHVDDIDGAYAAMHRWLKKDGVMSHRIDYTSHGIANNWYGHWTIPLVLWKIIRGRRAYFVNRFPHSAHIRALSHNGFKLICCEPTISNNSAKAGSMQIQYEKSDLNIKGAFIIAKPLSL